MIKLSKEKVMEKKGLYVIITAGVAGFLYGKMKGGEA